MMTKLPGFLYPSPTLIFRIKSVKSVKNVDEVFGVNQDQLSAKQSEKAICRLGARCRPPAVEKGSGYFPVASLYFTKYVIYFYVNLNKTVSKSE